MKPSLWAPSCQATQRPSARTARLRLMSTAALADAQRGLLSKTGAIHAAFDAGYLVLLAALPDHIAKDAQDHPNVELVQLACRLLRLPKSDRVIGHELATHYYDPNRLMLLNDCLRWAKRVRVAAGMS